MKITFCLPLRVEYPVGGFKIVYEYANRLVQRGHEITIAYDQSICFTKYKIPEILRKIGRIYSVKKPLRWFNLDKRIKSIATEGFLEHQIPDADVVIATAVNTAMPIAKLSKKKGKKYYLIQDFENWTHPDEMVKETYNYGMCNIVVSTWLKSIVDECSARESVLIPNGIDFKVFDIDNRIENRNKHSISFLYHTGEYKGTKYSIETVKLLKDNYPDLRVHAFGVPDRPEDLPEWIEYTSRATQSQLRKIYNSTSVFICSTIDEGFGLTGAESMACGCCLISTDYIGVHEYAEDTVNALLSPVKSPERMVENVIKVFEDNDLRIRLAKRGNEDVKKLSWERSVRLFEQVLNIEGDIL